MMKIPRSILILKIYQAVWWRNNVCPIKNWLKVFYNHSDCLDEKQCFKCKIELKYYLWAKFQEIWSLSKLFNVDIQRAIKAVKIKKTEKIFLPKERLYGYCISAKFLFPCNAIFIFSCIFFFTSVGQFFLGQALS